VDCFHEPFGDAYWLGPERQGERYEEVRGATGFAHVTYKSVVDDIKKMCELASLEVCPDLGLTSCLLNAHRF
jgi:hypothetical protein